MENLIDQPLFKIVLQFTKSLFSKARTASANEPNVLSSFNFNNLSPYELILDGPSTDIKCKKFSK